MEEKTYGWTTGAVDCALVLNTFAGMVWKGDRRAELRAPHNNTYIPVIASGATRSPAVRTVESIRVSIDF